MTGEPTIEDWTVLGLRPGASEAAVRTAYRELAKRFHPDRNPGDPDAQRRFQRINEAHAALRRRRRTVAASVPGEDRRASRSGALAALNDGGSLWVSPAALRVSPDRSARLRPDAEGTAFPTAQNTVRVERRGHGHHVFMPPQPSVRWQVAPPADDDLPVSALWVGDRQQDREQAAPRIPRRLLGPTVAELVPGDGGWVTTASLALDDEGRLSLDPGEPLSADRHPLTPLAVRRADDGWWVEGDLPRPSGTVATGARIPVAGVRRNGVEVPLPPAGPRP